MSNSLPLATPRNWRHENYEEDRYGNRHGHGRVPTSLPYRQEEGEHTYTPWRLFEERVRTGPYGLRRFPLQPYSPVRILIFDGTGNSSGVNPRLRQFIQNSPPRIRGEWRHRQEFPEAEEPDLLTQGEFNKAMKRLRKQLYKPTNPRRRAWRRGLFFGNSNNNHNDGRAGEGEDICSESKECAICLEAFVLNDKVLLTPCNHMFHHDCLVPWVKSRGQCPVCRLMLYERRLPAVSSSYNTNNDISVDRSRSTSANNNGVRIANDDEEMALDLIYLIRAMEEAFNWVNLAR